MANTLILKARIRKRDKDIRQAVEHLKLEEGEMADMIRDGLRKVLVERGVLIGKATTERY
ncbi:MAG TPA: hypothetical protein DEF42_03560 [Desulfosporosinus sp.]|nr:hypothetical protein [Desulfosporosinus sp.]